MIRVKVWVRIKVRFSIRVRIRLGSGFSDYNLATLHTVVLKFRTDALSVLERVKRLKLFFIIERPN